MFTRQADATAAAWPVAAKILTGNDVRHYPSGQGGLDFSPLQQELNARWAWYDGNQYAGCRYDWMGAPLGPVSSIAKALVPMATGIPPGFRNMAPPRQSEKRPSAPHRLVARVVDRFTSLLFAEDAHPLVRMVGDEETGYWLNSYCATTRLWAKMHEARTIGGAMGSVPIGFRFIDGVPRVEVHDPRWAKPVWQDKEALVLRALDIRYQVPATVKRDKRSQPTTEFYWFRRLISDQAEIYYKPVWCADCPKLQLDDGTVVEAGDGNEPNWQRLIDENKSVRHDLGFCPVVWVQNRPNHESPYGKADCHALYEQAMDIDKQRAGISTSTGANMDPTLVIADATGQIPETLRKGTGHGIGLQTGGTATYLEMSGSGINVAIEWFKECRDSFFEEAECLESFTRSGGPPQTAYEVGAKLGPQQSKVSVLREQYGQQGVRRLLDLSMRAALVLRGRGEEVKLEPRIVKPEEEDEDERVQPVVLGDGNGFMEVTWPPISRPTTTETSAAVTAGVAALTGGVIDQRAAVKYVAPYLGEDDVGGLTSRLKKAAEEQQAQFEESQQVPPGPGQPGQKPPGPPKPPALTP